MLDMLILDEVKLNPITIADIHGALSVTKPSVDTSVDKFKQWQNEFGSR